MTDASPESVGLATEPSDQSLLRKLQNGDQQAATTFYRRYARRLHALVQSQCSPELARVVEPEELVQSVFGTFFARASKGHYHAPDGKDLWGLLLVIILNKIRSKRAFYTAAKRDGRKTILTEDLDRMMRDKQADEVAAHFLHMVIDETLEDAPSAHLAIMQYRLQGHEVAEIAALTQRSKRTIERVLQDFRARLAKVLQADV